ncbi:hypothetical protein ACIGXM_18275 [Kitasatospora sp. NPDC052896]|uniref:hypothetical protein n=1 Tax=Kitasatospora sp. NPDC052896 TaxID=3364061 RepID=UPI0037C80198
MALQLSGAVRRRLPLVERLTGARRPAREQRHPVVAVAIALPCAVALLLLFGGWEQMLAQTRAVAQLIGR